MNIYRGGTTVASASTLVINLDSGLGDTSGGLVLSGGTLRTLGGVTLDPLRTVTLSGGGTIDTFGQSDACSAAIGGTGGLTVASSVGGGVLALSGANTYTGGTTISNAATLAIDNDGNLGPTSGGLVFKGGTLRTLSALTLDSSRAVTLNSGGGTIDTYGQSDAYSGVIGGAGGLSVASSVGGGVLTLSGVNTYGGGTTLNSGTLAVSGNQNLGASSGGLAFNGGTLRTTSSGFTSSRAVTLNNGGGTLDTDGQTDTLSGVIGGAGRLTVMDSSVLGGGTLLLSVANTYSGGTAINGAGLQSSAAGALGAGAVTMNSAAGRAADLNLNGYNQAIGSLAGDANSTVELSGAQLTAGADNTNTTFAGVISDGSFAGSLVKNGGGIFTLSGANTYTGPTTINAGALQLGADNALWSGGSLFVSNGGTFDLNGFNQTMAAATNNGTIKTGTGALKVTGSYGGGGNLSVALAPSVINLQVTGTANLTGQNLTVTGRPASGQYTVVQAGTLVGRFSSIGMPAGYLETATYGNTSLQLQVALGVAPLSGASPNQSSVINAMNSAAASNTSADFNQVLTALSNLAPAQAGSALNQISPVSLAAMSGVSSAGSSVHTAAVGQRMGGLQANGSNPDGGRFANFTVSGPAADLGLGTLVASASGAGAISLPVPDSNLGWGFFLSALGTYGQRNSLDTGSGIQPGYRFSDGGFALGTDYRFNENFAAGFSAGYSNGSAVFASNAGSVYSQSVRFGGYGTAYGGGAYANLYLGGAQDFFDTTRNIAFAGVSRSAVATPSGREFNMDAAVGYDLKGEQGTVSPFAGFSFDHLGVSRFTESGAGTLDLGVDAQDYESLRSRVGAKLSWKIPRGATTITYHVSAGWQHEFENQSQAIDAQFATGTGGPFAVTTANPNTDGALIGAGLDIDWGRGLSGKLAYVGDVRPDFNANTFSGSLRLKF
ncbi:MAG: autotransporter domain-containing protein [Elusimicrobia bacterium]|nr:autotransporter domain-containing protein [Elusimicrobiota bacterium]